MNNTLNIRTAFSVVLLSIFSAFLAGGLIMGIATSLPDSSKKIYTYISFFIGQGFMMVPLGYYLISQQQPILKRLRLRKVSPFIIGNTTLFGSGILILSDELDRLIQVLIPAPDYIHNMSDLMHPETITGFIIFIIAVVVVAPIGEEILFRGFLQQFLEQSVVPSLILHGLNNGMATILSFSSGEAIAFYTWKGHVSPWVLLPAIGLVIIGFKGINQHKGL